MGRSRVYSMGRSRVWEGLEYGCDVANSEGIICFC